MKKKCKVKKCPKNSRKNGYCDRHNAQMKTHGKIIGNLARSRKDFDDKNGLGRATEYGVM